LRAITAGGENVCSTFMLLTVLVYTERQRAAQSETQKNEVHEKPTFCSVLQLPWGLETVGK